MIMDVAICLNRLGVKPEILSLNQAHAPNHIIRWIGGDPQPTEAELEAAWQEHLAEQAATQYQRDRQPEYPSLATLADALYWSNQGDNTKLDEYYAACAAVKAKYPKPEVN
jgi:hypothetical protein